MRGVRHCVTALSGARTRWIRGVEGVGVAARGRASIDGGWSRKRRRA